MTLGAKELEECVLLRDQYPALVSCLTERLSGTEDGQPKGFRDSAVANLTDFFQRFQELNVRHNAQLDCVGCDDSGISRALRT